MKQSVNSIFAFLFVVVMSFNALAQEGNLSMSRYQLGSGDRISINVFGQDDLSMEVRYPMLALLITRLWVKLNW